MLNRISSYLVIMMPTPGPSSDEEEGPKKAKWSRGVTVNGGAGPGGSCYPLPCHGASFVKRRRTRVCTACLLKKEAIKHYSKVNMKKSYAMGPQTNRDTGVSVQTDAGDVGDRIHQLNSFGVATTEELCGVSE